MYKCSGISLLIALSAAVPVAHAQSDLTVENLTVAKNHEGGTFATITNDNPGSASTNAWSGMRLQQGGALSAIIASIGSGSTNAEGGPGALQVWNFNFAPVVFATAGAERMRIDSEGRVGIGTPAPVARLEVVSPGAAAAFDSGSPQDARLEFKREGARQGFLSWDAGTITLGGDSAPDTALLFRTRDAERMRIDAQGRVGIGTATPFTALDINGNSDATFPGLPVTMAVRDSREASTADAGGGISFGAKYTSSGDFTTLAVVSGVRETTQDGSYAGSLRFGTRSTGSGVGSSIERMRISSSGEVVIGQAGDSGQKLTVHGDITASGNLAAKFQDIAEWVPTTEQIPAGTVVVLDRSHNNHVRASSRAYDTSVAGVVSEQPGLILGEAGDAKAMIATTGRVRVKVDATRVAIAIGDLLVTSDLAGVAMKSQPIDLGGVPIHRPGTLIGKALEPLADGEGEILVLLSLQ